LEFDLPEDLRPRRREGASEIDEIGIDCAHRGEHVDHDGKNTMRTATRIFG
jgi:hypothetical protein